MLRKITKLALSIATLVLIMLPNLAYADTAKDAVCAGAGIASDNGTCAPTNGGATVNKEVVLAINVFSAIIGLVAVIMIMVAGIKYVTSQGESAQVSSAKDTLLYAVIGLVIAALAQIIVNFVLARLN